jgi:outer membrane protein
MAQADDGATSTTLKAARDAIFAGNNAKALAQLKPLEGKLAGNEDFDLLLGIAALESDQYEVAIAAFERVLAVNPENAGAQLDLARAYYATGAFALAEAMFTRLQRSNPPDAARTTIEQYLAAIRERKQHVRSGLNGHIDLSWGRDSNITGVPNDFTGAVFQSFEIPDIQATGNSVKRAAMFFNANGALEYGRELSRGYGLFGIVEGRSRVYREQRDFNVYDIGTRLGGSLNRGASQWRVAMFAQQLKQAGAAPVEPGEQKATNDRNTLAVAADWRRSVTPRAHVNASVQLGRVNFPRNRFEDINQTLVAVSYTQSFLANRAPLVYATVFASNDKAVRKLLDDVTDKGKRVVGARAYGQMNLVGTVQGFMQLGFSQRRDASEFARANTVARGVDRLADVAVGVNWRFKPECQLRTQMTYANNRSNIALYSYQRNEISTGVRCDMQ